ncbi:hypothetical protein PTI98_009157 [Pleurotus ostreatus]|nr:hypothetical protein PTI98_009157 [Pleurotus ostreatus]
MASGMRSPLMVNCRCCKKVERVERRRKLARQPLAAQTANAVGATHNAEQTPPVRTIPPQREQIRCLYSSSIGTISAQTCDLRLPTYTVDEPPLHPPVFQHFQSVY